LCEKKKKKKKKKHTLTLLRTGPSAPTHPRRSKNPRSRA
jgi:hypothetical protein